MNPSVRIPAQPITAPTHFFSCREKTGWGPPAAGAMDVFQEKGVGLPGAYGAVIVAVV